MATTLRAPDLWRGDIILTSMKLRLGTADSIEKLLGPAIENSFVNILTLSMYSHAMLYVGGGRILEFRNNISEKSLRDGLTDNGKDKPSVAHVFRHKKSNGKTREEIVKWGYKNKDAFKSVDPEYVLRVWAGLNHVGFLGRQEAVQGMMVCSTFVASTYEKAGLPLRSGPAHNMTPVDIALCADFESLMSTNGSFKDAVVMFQTASRRSSSRYRRGPPTLDVVGVVSPSEY